MRFSFVEVLSLPKHNFMSITKGLNVIVYSCLL